MVAPNPSDPSGRLRQPAPASTTLVIQTAFLGDVVLTMPLLAALARIHGPVDVVTTSQAAPLLENHPAVATVVHYDKRGADRGPAAWLTLARLLRGRRYRRAYLPHRSWRSAALAWAAGIPQRIGFADSPARRSYTQRVSRDMALHETRRLLALTGETPAAVDFDFGLAEDEIRLARDWLTSHGISQPFIAIAPGSVWGTKRWPAYPDLAARLDHPVVVVGGPREREAAAAIVAAAEGRAASAAGTMPLRVSAAILSCARLLVTNDSAPLHLAGAVGTPVVAIFGPTVPAFGFGPLGPDDVIVEELGLACRPCSPHGPMTCPLGHHRCMLDLTVDTVEQAVRRVWRATATGRDAQAETP
jgi:heptosyltransferase-2